MIKETSKKKFTRGEHWKDSLVIQYFSYHALQLIEGHLLEKVEEGIAKLLTDIGITHDSLFPKVAAMSGEVIQIEQDC